VEIAHGTADVKGFVLTAVRILGLRGEAANRNQDGENHSLRGARHIFSPYS